MEHMERFDFDEAYVLVGEHTVSMYLPDDTYVTNANVDYYYSERGYNCQTAEEVARQFYVNFRHLFAPWPCIALH